MHGFGDGCAMPKIVLLLLTLFGFNPGLQGQAPLLDALPPCQFAASAHLNNVQIGAVLLNLETGAGCTENLDVTFPVASVPKLFVAGAFLERVARNELTFQTRTTFTSSYRMGDSSACLSEDQLNQPVTLGFLSDSMIACSDNSATWMLMDYMGWDAVQTYVNRLRISGIGPIIPYSEVDRLKLGLLDERWLTVTRAQASQFYRRRETDQLPAGLFTAIPRYSRTELAAANGEYFARYHYNTATPRALAEYLLRLRANLEQTGTPEAQTAWWLFNTMLLTQRQYSLQALPGTFFVGAKNGFDYGVWAEVNTVYSSLETRAPQAIVIIFLQQTDYADPELQRPGDPDGVLNTYLRSLSPRIFATLYPDYAPPPPEIIPAPFIVFSERRLIENCWEWYAVSDFTALDRLAACWGGLQNIEQLPPGEDLGFGLILYGLDQQDIHLTFVYTAPDGEQYSYQRLIQQRAAEPVYWARRLDQPGLWRVEIFRELKPIYTRDIVVE